MFPLGQHMPQLKWWITSIRFIWVFTRHHRTTKEHMGQLTSFVLYTHAANCPNSNNSHRYCIAHMHNLMCRHVWMCTPWTLVPSLRPINILSVCQETKSALSNIYSPLVCELLRLCLHSRSGTPISSYSWNKESDLFPCVKGSNMLILVVACRENVKHVSAGHHKYFNERKSVINLYTSLNVNVGAASQIICLKAISQQQSHERTELYTQ